MKGHKIIKEKKVGRFRERIREDISWEKEIECASIFILPHMEKKEL